MVVDVNNEWTRRQVTNLLLRLGQPIVREDHVLRSLLVIFINLFVGYSYQLQDASGKGNNGQ